MIIVASINFYLLKNMKLLKFVIEDTVIHYQSANMICIEALLSIDVYINVFNCFYIV
jgi:hypothetical protein